MGWSLRRLPRRTLPSHWRWWTVGRTSSRATTPPSTPPTPRWTASSRWSSTTHARPDESLGVVALTERAARRPGPVGARCGRGGPSTRRPSRSVLAYLDADATPPLAVVSMSAASGLIPRRRHRHRGLRQDRPRPGPHRFPTLVHAGRTPPAAGRADRPARRRLTVVSAIRAGRAGREPAARRGVALARPAGVGARPAASRPGTRETTVAPDPLMTELAGRLRREGLVVQERLGTGPHRVDLAVTVPGHADRWLVAVDGDGPGYARTRHRERGPAVAGGAGAARLAPPAGLEHRPLPRPRP